MKRQLFQSYRNPETTKTKQNKAKASICVHAAKKNAIMSEISSLSSHAAAFFPPREGECVVNAFKMPVPDSDWRIRPIDHVQARIGDA